MAKTCCCYVLLLCPTYRRTRQNPPATHVVVDVAEVEDLRHVRVSHGEVDRVVMLQPLLLREEKLWLVGVQVGQLAVDHVDRGVV